MTQHISLHSNMVSQVHPSTSIVTSQVRLPSNMTTQAANPPYMTSQLRHNSPYGYPINTPPLNSHDVMPNMRLKC